MNDRQFLWGLSNGVMVFAVAGAFWLGLGIGMAGPHVGWQVSASSTVIQVGVLATLLRAAVKLKRRSRFLAAELRQSDGGRTPETKRILIGLCRTVAGQTVLIALAVWICVRADAQQLIWPAMALVVSLHLVPLARIFHVRAYYATAAAGSLVSLAALGIGTGTYAVVCLAVAMAAVMWTSAVYLLVNADTIATRAVGERWEV